MRQLRHLADLGGNAIGVAIGVPLFIVAAGAALVFLLAITSLIPFGKLKELWKEVKE